VTWRPALGALVVAGLVLAGCQRDDPDAAATTTAPPGTAVPGTTVPGTTVPDGGSTTDAEPDPTFAQVTTTVIGVAVAGNSGEVGSASGFSETVRNADGTCSGQVGPDGQQWTQGLETGAPVTFLADDGTPIGSGQITTSAWEDVDPSGNEQWNCTFSIEGEVTGQPDSFKIQVAGLEPWRAHADPRDPARFVVSVDTTARFDVFSECTEPPTGLTEVFEFAVVGEFWADGIPRVCDSGLVVVDIERPCRPAEFASEYIIAVTRADDPSIVIEDASGFAADTSQLAVGTEVVVHVAIGRPCG
jgi:hypothetical protein